MFGKLILKLVFAGALLASGAAWAADPSVDQVYQAARDGNYSQAQSMMDQVLRDHPNSAKAHFIEAELLARQGKLTAARSEFDTAQKLDSSLSFAKPGAVQELKSMLSSGGGAMSSRAGGVHVPWGPLLAILAFIVVVLMIVRSRSQRMADPGMAGGMRPMPGGPMMPSGYGPGGATMAPPMAGGGMGSGILGGLATGAAVGAGMVAGEALAHRVLGDGSHNVVPNNDYAQGNPGNYDMGGNDFGVNDANSWNDNSGGGGASDWGDSGGGGSDDDWS